MALQAAYKQYLAAPNASFLAENASLHYITTLTTFNGPTEIIKHLNNQIKKVKKKEEKIIDAIEGDCALALEIETSVEFVDGGGAFLPGIDDNFLSDRIVTLPIIHIVSFDLSGKITQIRLNWDQGSLLKLIDAIGKTGRNWPIRDGEAQIKLIQSSVISANKPSAAGSVPVQRDGDALRRSRENSTNVTRDPHASLALFAPREVIEDQSLPAVVAPRSSAKPPPRDLNELFGSHDTEENSTAQAKDNRPESRHSAKAGAGKNFQPSRIFDTASVDNSADGIATNSKKYEHFDIASGTGSDGVAVKKGAFVSEGSTNKTKHAASWNFDDFNTPEKAVPTKGLAVNVKESKHWGTENDDVPDSPIRKPKVDQPRKDAKPHFEFEDDATPLAQKKLPTHPRGSGVNTGMSLYQNNVYGGEDEYESPPKAEINRPLNNLTNVKGRKDYGPNFDFTDDSPAPKQSAHANQKENVPIAPSSPSRAGQPRGISVNGDGMGGKKALNSHADKPRGINIGGDGMGGKKGGGRSWGFGDDSDGEEAGGTNGAGGKFMKGVAPKKAGNAAQTGGGAFWDF